MSDEVEAPSIPNRDPLVTATTTDETGVVRAQYEWSSTEPSTAVIEAVSTVVNREPTDLEPLYDAIDPDALNALVGTEGADAAVSVSFPFVDRLVTVHATGEVVVGSAKPNIQ